MDNLGCGNTSVEGSECIYVKRRIACNTHKYPPSEAMYVDFAAYTEDTGICIMDLMVEEFDM